MQNRPVSLEHFMRCWFRSLVARCLTFVLEKSTLTARFLSISKRNQQDNKERTGETLA